MNEKWLANTLRLYKWNLIIYNHWLKLSYFPTPFTESSVTDNTYTTIVKWSILPPPFYVSAENFILNCTGKCQLPALLIVCFLKPQSFSTVKIWFLLFIFKSHYLCYGTLCLPFLQQWSCIILLVVNTLYAIWLRLHVFSRFYSFKICFLPPHLPHTLLYVTFLSLQSPPRKQSNIFMSYFLFIHLCCSSCCLHNLILLCLVIS